MYKTIIKGDNNFNKYKKGEFMKKFLIVLICVLTLSLLCLSSLEKDKDFLRLHVKANSNSQIDQEIKIEVRDIVNSFVKENLNLEQNYVSKESVKQGVSENKARMQEIVDKFLKEKGCGYKSTIVLEEKYFPLRQYGEKVFPSGSYEAVNVYLGEGKGANWWCVVYPPLCYLEGKDVEGESIVYKSKIYEMIEDYRK